MSSSTCRSGCSADWSRAFFRCSMSMYVLSGLGLRRLLASASVSARPARTTSAGKSDRSSAPSALALAAASSGATTKVHSISLVVVTP